MKKKNTETSQTKNDLPEEVVFQALGMSDYLTDHRILNAWTDLKQSGDGVLPTALQTECLCSSQIPMLELNSQCASIWRWRPQELD